MSSTKNSENSALKLAQFKSLDSNEKCMDNYVDVIFQELDVNEKVQSTSHLKNHHSELIGDTLLHLAYKEKNINAFDMLIKRGADFCMKDSKGNTVLHNAFQYDTSAWNSFEWNTLKSYFCTESFLFVVSVLSAHVKHENSNNASDSNGLTHFHVACATNNIEAVEFFLKSGVPVNQVVFKAISGECFEGYTGLHFAAQYGYSEVIDLLLEHGANANLEDAKGRTPLCIALERNIAIIDSVQKMYRPLEISINQKIIKLLINHDVSANSLHLYIASSMDSTTEIKNYLTQDVDVNESVSMDSRNWPGYTALHFAAHVNFNTVKLLIKHGGDIEAKDANGVTPFDMCIKRYTPEDIIDILRLVPKWRNIVLSDGKTKLTDLLMAFRNIMVTRSFLEESDDNVGLFIPQNSPLWPGFTVLHLAVLYSENFMSFRPDLAMIKECLEHGSNVTVKDFRNWTPIHLAFRLNKLKTVDLMLEYHHRMQNYVDDENLSHLHAACALKNSKFVEKLLWNYADVNVVYKGKSSISSVTPGSTPLHIAVRNNDDKIVKLLLQFGADPHVPDARTFTPIHHLTYHLHFLSQDIANKLLSMVKLSDHVVEDVGLSYLHIAAGALNVDAVKTLLDLGVDVNKVVKVDSAKGSHLKIHNGNTALHFALAQPNSSDIVKLLLERGANILVDNCLSKILSSRDYTIHDVLVTTLTRDVNNLQTRVEEDTGMTLLHVVCCSAHVDLIKKVLDIGDDVNAKIHENSTFRPGCTPLHLLVYDEYSESRVVEEAIELLVRRGADVNVKNKEGVTPLHLAYEKLFKDRVHFISNLTQVNWLLQAQKNFHINPTDVGGISHFHIACHLLNVEVIEKFLKHNVDVNATIDSFHDPEIAGCSPLLLTVKDVDGRKKCTTKSSAKFRVVELLIRHGARVNVEDIDGNTAGHYAVTCVLNKNDPRLTVGMKEKNFLQLLASAGADTNAKNVRKKTPLELLINKESLKLDDARYFIKCGCTLNAFDQMTEEGYIARINALLSHGDMEYLLEETFTNYPNSVKRDDRNRTAIHNLVSIECCENDEKELAELIDTMIGFDCDIDEQDDSGKTALHVAVQFRNEKAAKGLLLAGADINISDHDGKTPFAYMFEPCSHSNNSTENHNQYDHRELFDAFVYHVKKMENCGLSVEESNANLLNNALIEFDIDEDQYDMDDFYDEFNQMVELKIKPYSITLMDFVYNADIVFDYPRMFEKKCNAIDTFFENNLSNFRDEFRNAAGIFQLQYRQAVQRRKRFSAAENALMVLTRLRLPNVCSDIIFKFLENFELRNLIASTE